MDNFYYSSDSFQGSLRITPKYLWNLSLYMHKLWVKMYETLAKANSIYLSIYIEKLVGILRSFKVQSLILFLFWRRHQFRCVAPPPFLLSLHPSPYNRSSNPFFSINLSYSSPFTLLLSIHPSFYNTSFSFQPIYLL